MKKFYLTFGVQYAHEPHPRGVHVHPDGYVVITARDMDVARDIVVQLYGRNWSNLYSENEFMQEDVTSFYPKGPLLNIQVP